VLVVVLVVPGVPVAVVLVVDVIAVRHWLMPAPWPVHMRVTGVRQVRQGVLVVVIIMLGVGVAFVDVVGVIGPFHTRVPAPGPVVMCVRSMNRMLVGGHGSSLLCWTASATMCATCWSARE